LYNIYEIYCWFNQYIVIKYLLFFVLGFMLIIILFWLNIVTKEATIEGFHTKAITENLISGMILFLCSEAMLFFPFFWSYFHASFTTSIFIEGKWPVVGIVPLDTMLLPFCNTLILLSSGVSLIAAHRAIISKSRIIVLWMLALTILYGILFSWFQFIEYGLAFFNINDSIYGSTFYLLTGLHGFHVIVGVIFLLASYIRMLLYHFFWWTFFRIWICCLILTFCWCCMIVCI